MIVVRKVKFVYILVSALRRCPDRLDEEYEKKREVKGNFKMFLGRTS